MISIDIDIDIVFKSIDCMQLIGRNQFIYKSIIELS